MDYVKIQGVEVALPTIEQWRAAIVASQLSDQPLASPGVVSSWLDSYSQVPSAVLGARSSQGKWWAVPLLRLGSTHYPVHFEDVICTHCKERCGLSACPDVISLSSPSHSTIDAWALFRELPVLQCPHCQTLLSHRQTIWLASEQFRAA